MLIELTTAAIFCVFLLAALCIGKSLTGGTKVPAKGRSGGESARKRRGPLFGPFTGALAAQLPQPSAEAASLEQDLRRAGYYRPTARRDFLAVRNLLAITIVVAAGALAVWLGPSHSHLTAGLVIGGVALAATVICAARFHIYLKGKRRVQQVQDGLPDAMDMISMCVSGGLSLNDALERVGRDLALSHAEVARELEIVREHAEIGTLEQALRGFSNRIDAPVVKSMAAVVNQSERLGTNVVTALHDYADSMRQQHRQRAEERANKTGVKMLFPLVFCMAPSIFLLLWGPAVLELRSFLQKETRPGGILEQADPSLLRQPRISPIAFQGPQTP
jgi:tight adherence protein C